MKLPTILGKQLLTNYISVRMVDAEDVDDAIAGYQRMALVADQETAWAATIPWFKPECRTVMDGSPEHKALVAVHTMVKPDVLGHAVDCLLGIVNNHTGSTKEKIAASTVINELYGDKQIMQDKGLADKLILNLGGNKRN